MPSQVNGEPLKTAFVTGATGFVGSHLASALLSQGWRVKAAARCSSSLARVPHGCAVERTGFDSPAGLRTAMEGADAVFHLAGATSARSQEEFDCANALVTRAVAGAWRDAAPGSPLVLVSSQSATGPCGEGPMTPYGRSKLAAEAVVRRCEGDWVIVRPPAVFGPGDDATAPLFRMASKGLFLSPGGMNTGFSLVYVKDLAALLAGLPGNASARRVTLEPSYGRIFSWREFRKAMEAAAGRRLLHLVVPAPLVIAAGFLSETAGALSGQCPVFDRHKSREFLASGWECEAGPVERLTGWKASTPLEDALRETMEWVRGRRQ